MRECHRHQRKALVGLAWHIHQCRTNQHSLYISVLSNVRVTMFEHNNLDMTPLFMPNALQQYEIPACQLPQIFKKEQRN